MRTERNDLYERHRSLRLQLNRPILTRHEYDVSFEKRKNSVHKALSRRRCPMKVMGVGRISGTLGNPGLQTILDELIDEKRVEDVQQPDGIDTYVAIADTGVKL